jgi:transglutaminase-like putative cysteine protease
MSAMKIRFGYELVYSIPQPTSMILMLHAQPNPTQRLLAADHLRVEPECPLTFYRDLFGNTGTRLDTPVGTVRITADAVLEDSGLPETESLTAREHPLRELPDEALVYLLPSRYCESDVLIADAQRLFGHLAPGWSRVQAICDFVNQHVAFGYQYARCTKTALETYRERQGVCRDFSHLAIALCRGMGIPARYTTSYLGDIGVPAADSPMDFAGAMEVYLGGAWHTFDPRNNARRIGRLTIARGRDAADVAISTAFGPASLQLFRVWTDEIDEAQASALVTNNSPLSLQSPARAA